MTIHYLREDKNGNPVKVEIWRDNQNGKIIRIKRVVFGPITYRVDFYQEDDEKRFKVAFTEEIMALIEYGDKLQQILEPIQQPEQKDNNNASKFEEDAAMAKLRQTVMLLQR